MDYGGVGTLQSTFSGLQFVNWLVAPYSIRLAKVLSHVKQLKSYRDDAIASFQQFTEVDIIAILKNYPSISHVYLTRRVAGFWRQKWLPIENYCQANAKVVQTLLTPSGSARFQMRSGMQRSLVDFIFQSWQDQWHFVPF